MLTLTEEILLLLGDEEGAFLPVQKHAFECALAGAVLLDLAFKYRIDTDLQALVVTDPTPTGNGMLDRILAKIAARTETTDTQTWIRVLSAGDAVKVREQALTSLVERGILKRQQEGSLWAFRSFRYPALDRGAERAIKSRLERALADSIPEPRDIALICLVDACQIFADLFPDRDIEETASRIEQLRRMDLIGREVAGTIADIRRTIIQAAGVQAVRFQKKVLTLSAAGGLGAAATLLAPRIPLPDQYGPTVLEHLWFDGFWQQWSGYLLLGLSVVAFVIAIVIRKRLIARIAGSYRWRLSHFVLGISCVLALFAHTGFRFGNNVNAILMGFYIVALLSGGLAGTVIGGARWLRRKGLVRSSRPRRVLLWLHIVAICPLPALLIVHILAVYLY